MGRTLTNYSKAHSDIIDPNRGSLDYTGTYNYSTPYSSVVNGVVTIDPSIRATQDQVLNRNSTGLNQYLTDTDSLRSRFLGNESAYSNSVLDPLRQSIATGQGNLERSIGLRGIAGSSFGDQALTNYLTDTGRSLRDATAQTEQESIGGLAGLDINRFNAIQTANQTDSQVARDRLQQELQALGLGQQEIQQQLTQFDNQQQRKLQSQQNLTNSMSAIDNSARSWYSSVMGGGLNTTAKA